MKNIRGKLISTLAAALFCSALIPSFPNVSASGILMKSAQRNLASVASIGKIAFASDRDGNFEIYVMDADGGGQLRLTENPAEDYSPTWAPDGSRLAFVSTAPLRIAL